jgi:hypothetical protein
MDRGGANSCVKGLCESQRARALGHGDHIVPVPAWSVAGHQCSSQPSRKSDLRLPPKGDNGRLRLNSKIFGRTKALPSALAIPANIVRCSTRQSTGTDLTFGSQMCGPQPPPAAK